MNIESAKYLAFKLMTQHGLIMTGWNLVIDNAVKRFGRCSYRLRQINLSGPLIELNDESEVRDVILHEIAHALTKGDGHGARWKAKCVEIGCRPVRCYTTDNVTQPAMRYQATCGGCGRVHQRTRAVDKFGPKRSCRCQKGPWDKRILLVYVDTHKQSNIAA
jgi:predicted SprT family Zn-dependent metalloprotease